MGGSAVRNQTGMQRRLRCHGAVWSYPTDMKCNEHSFGDLHLRLVPEVGCDALVDVCDLRHEDSAAYQDSDTVQRVGAIESLLPRPVCNERALSRRTVALALLMRGLPLQSPLSIQS